MEYKFVINGETRPVRVSETSGAGHYRVELGGSSREVEARRVSEHEIHFVLEGRRCTAWVSEEAGRREVFFRGRTYELRDPERRSRGPAGAAAGEVTPPMPATVTAVLAAEGDRVKAGQPVIKLMAMKMEHTLTAPYDGVVVKVDAAVDEQVMPGRVLVEIEKESGDE